MTDLLNYVAVARYIKDGEEDRFTVIRCKDGVPTEEPMKDESTANRVARSIIREMKKG